MPVHGLVRRRPDPLRRLLRQPHPRLAGVHLHQIRRGEEEELQQQLKRVSMMFCLARVRAPAFSGYKINPKTQTFIVLYFSSVGLANVSVGVARSVLYGPVGGAGRPVRPVLLEVLQGDAALEGGGVGGAKVHLGGGAGAAGLLPARGAQAPAEERFIVSSSATTS